MAIKKSSKADSINYKVLEECGTVSHRKGDYVLKLRYLQWNDHDPVYDLRPWKINDAGEEICGKGITVSGEELENLFKVIKAMIDDE